MPETQKITQDDKIWGLLSYIWIFSLVALASRKDNSFVRFHANQGALLFALSLAGFFPMLGQLLLLVLCILAIIGMIKAYGGEKWELPLLASPAKDFGDWLIKILKL